MTKECCLRSVTTIPQMIKWIELMLGLDFDSNDYKIDRPYIQEQFDKENYKLPYHSKILQKYGHALYLLYFIEGKSITNCRYFKSVNSALKYREMILMNKSKFIIKKRARKRMTDDFINKLKSDQKLRDRKL